MDPNSDSDSTVNKKYSPKRIRTTCKESTPWIDPAIIVISDTEENIVSFNKHTKNSIEPVLPEEDELSKHSSPKWPQTVHKRKYCSDKTIEMSKKNVKKSKPVMKISSSLFQKNPKHSHSEMHDSDVQHQEEDLEIGSFTKEPTTGTGKNILTTTVKNTPVVMLNDVLPNLNTEQLKQLKFHEHSFDNETHTNASQTNTVSLEHSGNLSVNGDAGMHFGTLKTNELMNEDDMLKLDLSPSTATASRDIDVMRCSPGQLQKSSLITYKKKQITSSGNFISVSNTAANDSRHRSRFEVINDASNLSPKSKGLKSGQSPDKKQKSRGSPHKMKKVPVSNQAASEANSIMNRTQSSDQHDIFSDKIESIHRPQKEQNLSQTVNVVIEKRKRRKRRKRRRRSETKHVFSTHGSTQKLKEDNSHLQASRKDSATTDTQTSAIQSTLTQKNVECSEAQGLTQRGDIPKCSASLIKDIVLVTLDVDKTGVESISQSPCDEDFLETDTLPDLSMETISASPPAESNMPQTSSYETNMLPSLNDVITASDKSSCSSTSSVKVPASPTRFKVGITDTQMISDPAFSMRPMLEKLSPEKTFLKTTTPKKASSNNYTSPTNTVEVDTGIEKMQGKDLNDRVPFQSKTLSSLKTKSTDVASSKSTDLSKRHKKQKRSPESESFDYSKLSPRHQSNHRRKLRKRKPVLYSDEIIHLDSSPKPPKRPKVPKVSKERRFQHICIRERKGIHEIVIIVESASQKHLNSGMSKKYNFLFAETLVELTKAFQTSQQNEKCKAVVLSSVGPIFCSGLDPTGLLKWSPEQPVIQDILEHLKLFVDMLIRYSKPIIAIVQGPAVGFGATLLLHCDSVYISERASLQWPFTQIGLSPFGCTTQLLNQTVGLCRARSILLEGRIITAQMAKNLGIVTEVFRHDSLLANAWPLCTSLLHRSEFASHQTKMLINVNSMKSLVECNCCEIDNLKRCLKTPTCQKYLRSYVVHHLRYK